jgi:hypothetical protein
MAGRDNEVKIRPQIDPHEAKNVNRPRRENSYAVRFVK